MLISILINNFNYGRFLRQAIDSALDQTWERIQVVVVDDGSQDDSSDIIHSYGDRISALFKSNGGQNSCLNAGFKLCRGDGIIILDADDFLLPTAAAMHASRLSIPGVVNSCGYLEVVSSDGTPLNVRQPHKLGASGDYAAASLQYGLDVYEMTVTSGHAWARQFLQQVLPLPHDPEPGIDGYLTAVDRFFGRIEFIHEPVGCYRRHGENKGPMSMEFSEQYLARRINARATRIQFAKEWAAKLGLADDGANLHNVRGWRTVLMKHSLGLLQSGRSSVPCRDLLAAPFRRDNRSFWRPLLLSAALGLVWCLPRKPALGLSQGLLRRTQRVRH